MVRAEYRARGGACMHAFSPQSARAAAAAAAQLRTIDAGPADRTVTNEGDTNSERCIHEDDGNGSEWRIRENGGNNNGDDDNHDIGAPGDLS